MKGQKRNNPIAYGCYRVIRGIVQLVYPKITIEGLDNLPQEPCLLVGNHCKMNGPIIGELYIPGDRAIWCAGEMMEWSAVPDYAFQDFWSQKPRWIRWYYRILSYLITPISVCVFNHANTIPVYRDQRIMTTFRQSVTRLTEGANVVVFPECAQPHNRIVNAFQEGFVDVARLYWKKTGKEVSFVPLYIAPTLKKAYLGKPIRFCASAGKEEERRRICGELMDAITKLAQSLPLHTVTPYNNIPKRDYPQNLPKEVKPNNETSCC